MILGVDHVSSSVQRPAKRSRAQNAALRNRPPSLEVEAMGGVHHTRLFRLRGAKRTTKATGECT